MRGEKLTSGAAWGGKGLSNWDLGTGDRNRVERWIEVSLGQDFSASGTIDIMTLTFFFGRRCGGGGPMHYRRLNSILASAH